MHRLFKTQEITHTHTHPFNGPFSGTTRVSQYQKGKTNLDFTEATAEVAVASAVSDAPRPAAQPTVSKH